MKVSGEQSIHMNFVCKTGSLFYCTYPGIEHSVSLHLPSPASPRLPQGAGSCLRAAADDDGEDDHSDQEHLGQHRQADEQDVEYPLLQH